MLTSSQSDNAGGMLVVVGAALGTLACMAVALDYGAERRKAAAIQT